MRIPKASTRICPITGHPLGHGREYSDASARAHPYMPRCNVTVPGPEIVSNAQDRSPVAPLHPV